MNDINFACDMRHLGYLRGRWPCWPFRSSSIFRYFWGESCGPCTCRWRKWWRGWSRPRFPRSTTCSTNSLPYSPGSLAAFPAYCPCSSKIFPRAGRPLGIDHLWSIIAGTTLSWSRVSRQCPPGIGKGQLLMIWICMFDSTVPSL